MCDNFQAMKFACVLLLVFSIGTAGFGSSVPAVSESPINPNLKYPTLESYEETIKEAGVLLDSNNVRLYAPKKRAKEAGIIFKYLVKAYNELYRIVGTHTEYKIIVYHFPAGHPDAKGGTSNCTIWYSYENLQLENQEEWLKYKVPNMAGYIEEMAHNFVSATYATFGWEMIGWTIGTDVTGKIAGNPILSRNLEVTRQDQEETFDRYIKNGYVFPRDLPANKCDRIHAWVLYDRRQKYGPNFWPDFFKEILKHREHLVSAAKLGDSDKVRNRCYQITLDCFDRLPGLDFKQRLKELRISLDVDVKSLHPTEKNWDRRFILREGIAEKPSDVNEHKESKKHPNKESPVPIEPNTLPPLHLAVYHGEGSKAKELIEKGADIESKDINGRTPLHIAAMRGHIGLAQMLMKMGSDTTARDKQGNTPAELAEICGNEGTAEVLRNKQKGE